jgi:uncharacterized protein involved in exopolysaccharide biosynthesis
MNRFFSDNNQNQNKATSLTIYEKEIKPINKRRWKFLLLTLVITNAGIWGAALVYISRAKPKYVSDWSINVLGTASSSNINIPEIGQATSQDASAYAGISYDPRENYKAIATSEQVLNLAATSANMKTANFGAPRIKIVDNTTLMRFEFQGTTPAEAHKKSQSFYDTLMLQINKLRSDDIAQQNARLQIGIESSRKKLKASQQKLSEYKVISGLSANEQLSNLAINIETLRKQRAELIAQEKQSSARVFKLKQNLNLSSEQASDAFVLQADQLFQKYLVSYNEAKAKLVVLKAKFLPSHPSVINQDAEVKQAESALTNRANILLKRPFNIVAIDQFNFSDNESSGPKRAALSEKLVTTDVDNQGLKAQIKSLNQQIFQLEYRLKVLSQRQSKLEDLKRDVQIAEAVFSSTIARLDLAKSSVSSAYPQIQLLSKPSLPSNGTGVNRNLVFLGAVLGSILFSSGLVRLSQDKLSKSNHQQDSETNTVNSKKPYIYETSEL